MVRTLRPFWNGLVGAHLEDELEIDVAPYCSDCEDSAFVDYLRLLEKVNFFSISAKDSSVNFFLKSTSQAVDDRAPTFIKWNF